MLYGKVLLSNVFVVNRADGNSRVILTFIHCDFFSCRIWKVTNTASQNPLQLELWVWFKFHYSDAFFHDIYRQEVELRILFHYFLQVCRIMEVFVFYEEVLAQNPAYNYWLPEYQEASIFLDTDYSDCRVITRASTRGTSLIVRAPSLVHFGVWCCSSGLPSWQIASCHRRGSSS